MSLKKQQAPRPLHCFSSRELATILAALRYWQQDLILNEDPPIGPHFNEVSALTPDEIDALCERLNVK